MNQHWYHCHTCKMIDRVGVCSVCARVCHRGHDVTYAKFGNFFCDCGARESGSCQVNIHEKLCLINQLLLFEICYLKFLCVFYPFFYLFLQALIKRNPTSAGAEGGNAGGGTSGNPVGTGMEHMLTSSLRRRPSSPSLDRSQQQRDLAKQAALTKLLG